MSFVQLAKLSEATFAGTHTSSQGHRNEAGEHQVGCEGGAHRACQRVSPITSFSRADALLANGVSRKARGRLSGTHVRDGRQHTCEATCDKAHLHMESSGDSLYGSWQLCHSQVGRFSRPVYKCYDTSRSLLFCARRWRHILVRMAEEQ